MMIGIKMKDVYLKKNQLYKDSLKLNDLSKDDTKHSFEIKKMQNEVYKKYKFFDGYLKASNKK